MKWLKKWTQKRKPKNNLILPDGFYDLVSDLPDEVVASGAIVVEIKMGYYKGILLAIDPVFKIRHDYLTGSPGPLYDYVIVDESSFHPDTSNDPPNLMNIVAAIIHDYASLSDTIDPTPNDRTNRNINIEEPDF